MRLVGSIAIHAFLVGALLVLAPDHERDTDAEIGRTMSIVEVVRPIARAATAETAVGASAAPSGPRDPRSETRTPKAASSASVNRRRAARPLRRTGSVRSLVDDIGIDEGGGIRGAGGDGDGDGRGNGGGDGRGGRGNGLAALPDPGPPPPPPPRVVEPRPSKARPPRLIYPARHRPVDDSQLFVAQVAIDREGFVVGAKLLRGLGGPRDSEASSLIFRFRYEPALDHDGRAIAATIEQPFGVQ